MLAPNDNPIQIPNIQVKNDKTFVVGLCGGVTGGGKEMEWGLVGEGRGGRGLLLQARADGLEVAADWHVGG